MRPYTLNADLLRHALLGHSLAQVGDSLLEAKVSEPITGRLSVHVFNHPTDKDDDPVFGKNGHIAFDLRSAWIKYKLTAKAGAGLAFRPVSARPDAEITLSDYRIHR